jgi:hypothetical protein
MTQDATSPSNRAIPPIRIRLPGFIDVLVVGQSEHIRWLNQHRDVVRPLDPSASWLHKLIHRRLSSDLAFQGKVLPVFLGRDNTERAARQKSLEERLEDMRGSPGEERDRIAKFVAGERETEDIGVMVQQWCGRLFISHYRSAREVYEAGRLIAGWPSAMPWSTFMDRKSGRLTKAKEVIGNVADNDLHCMHATSIGMENVARSVRKLRWAALLGTKQGLPPDEILRQCLTAPPAVLRGCAREISVPFLKRPLTRSTLIVFLVARAYASSGDLDDAFLGDSWSACPARVAIPEMLRAVWHSAHNREPADATLRSKINSWSRRLRAVS